MDKLKIIVDDYHSITLGEHDGAVLMKSISMFGTTYVDIDKEAAEKIVSFLKGKFDIE